MSNFTEIDPALVRTLREALPAYVNSIAYENGPVFDPKHKPVWFEVSNLINPAEAVTLGRGGDDEVTGVFQINICVPLNTSTAATNAIIKLINNCFAIGRPISYGSTVLKIKRCGKSGASGQSNGCFRSIVSVYWSARLERNENSELALLNDGGQAVLNDPT